MPVCGPSLFGSDNNYIKVGNGQLVAVEGSKNAETLNLSDLRIPYKQLLKSKILIKKGQENYLLNHLGLGDNATFIAIKVIYNQKSLEIDNYLNWSYFDNINQINKIGSLMVLTGNSTNRIPQIYITNPNQKYDVYLEVMVAVVDDQTFFNYSPTVYFTDVISISNVQYNGPYNTSLGDNFEASVSLNYYYYTLTKSGLIYLLIDNIKDSNGVDMDISESYIKIYSGDEEVDSINSIGEYIIKFEITDTLGYSIDSKKNIKIIVTE